MQRSLALVRWGGCRASRSARAPSTRATARSSRTSGRSRRCDSIPSLPRANTSQEYVLAIVGRGMNSQGIHDHRSAECERCVFVCVSGRQERRPAYVLEHAQPQHQCRGQISRCARTRQRRPNTPIPPPAAAAAAAAAPSSFFRRAAAARLCSTGSSEISGWLTWLTSAITPARRRALVTMIGAPDRPPWSARVCGRRVQLDSRRQRQLPDRCLERCCLAGSGPVQHANTPEWSHVCDDHAAGPVPCGLAGRRASAVWTNRPGVVTCVRRPCQPVSHSRILAVEHRGRCARIGADRLVRCGRSCATRRRRRRSSP